jgi:hypothetical protein
MLFHCNAKLGSYVYLFLPLYTHQTIGDTPRVNYQDVLMPAEHPEKNTLLTTVPVGKSFSCFFLKLDAKDFQMHGVGFT